MLIFGPFQEFGGHFEFVRILPVIQIGQLGERLNGVSPVRALTTWIIPEGLSVTTSSPFFLKFHSTFWVLRTSLRPSNCSVSDYSLPASLACVRT